MEIEYYLEFSRFQRQYNVTTMENIQESNIKLFERGEEPHWFIIDGPGTLEEMLASSEVFETTNWGSKI